MSRRALITAAACLLAATAPASAGEAPDRVLSPEAAERVKDALALGEALRGGATLSAAIDKDRVVVTAKDGEETVLAVTLVHPEDAPPEAPRAAGVAVLDRPGPAPEAAVKQILARLQRAPAPIPWSETRRTPAPEPAATPQGATAHELDKRLEAISHCIKRGDVEQAREQLRELPTDLAPDARLAVAQRYVRLGEMKKAAELIGDPAALDPSSRAAALAVLGRDEALDALVAATAADKRCGLVGSSYVLDELGRRERALEVAQAIGKAGCLEARVVVLQEMTQLGRNEGAVAEAEALLEAHPDDTNVMAAAAGAYQGAGDLPKAVELLEKRARSLPRTDPSLAPLLGAMVRDVDHREAYFARLRAAVKADPDDVISRFLLGVLNHYENHFERSNELLQPLEDVLGHEDRLHIYLAMNDFNLGRTADAIARLERRAARPTPDPDVFYCRAEILRDTDRAQALADLKRYRALSQSGALSNPEKEKRVARMQALLEACLADGRDVCEGPWEHPRLRDRSGPWWQEYGPPIGGAVLVVLLGVWLLVRRRSR